MRRGVVTMLACTICGQPKVAIIRLEITGGAATYLVCCRLACIDEALARARDNLHNVARRAGASHDGAIEAQAVEAEATELTP